jgi:hypothetical protein
VQTVATDKADGYAGWFSFNFTPDFAAFVRVDETKPSKDLAPNLKNTYANLGVAYRARKNVDLALAYKQDKVEKGTMSLSNGTIGGSNEGKFNEIGFWAQVVF